MRFIQIRDDEAVRVTRLTRPKANALNAQMVEEMIEMVRAAERDASVHALVFESGQKSFFSAGFDVREVFAYPPDAMRDFFLRFIDLYDSLLRFPKPVVGALSGHTVAGGAFLALTFDRRVMIDGDYTIAVNEVKFGALIPSAIRRLLIDLVGARAATRMILTGDGMKPNEAAALGLVDALTSEADLLPTALNLARQLAAKPKEAFGRSKLGLHKDLGHLRDAAEDFSVNEFLDQWFSSECVQLRTRLTESLEREC